MEIPQDIIDHVIAAVGHDEHLLKQCALVSSSFLRPSRKKLFSQIILSGWDETSQRLHQVLIQNPVIWTFVRSIAITQYLEDETSKCQLNSTLAILQLPFCCLERFSIGLQ